MIFVAVVFIFLIRNSISQDKCIFEYYSNLSPQGEINSPNYPNPYPNNLDCRYEFYARDNERVIIQVEDFELEPAQSTAMHQINFMDFIQTNTRSNQPTTSKPKEETDSKKQCFYDFLDVFTSDGTGRLHWRSRHCGSQIDRQIVSTSPTLVLVFQTDRMLSYRGFKFYYHFSPLNILPFITDPICGPSELIGNGSLIASPNYPMMFPSDIECAWTITVEKHQNILVKFLDVNLNEPCHRSQISIWDGYVSDTTRPDFVVCEKLTYYHKGILQYKSKGNRIVVRFIGNKNMNRHETVHTTSTKKSHPAIKNGFFATWNGIRLDDDCQEDFQCKGGEYCIDSKNFLCQQTYRYCISKSLVCDGILNCDTGDESDEKHCELTFVESRIFIMIAVIGPTIFVFISVLFWLLHKINKNKCDNKNSDNERKFPMPAFIVAQEGKNAKKVSKVLVFRKNECDRLRKTSSEAADPFDSSDITSNSDNLISSKTNNSKLFQSKHTESRSKMLDDIDTRSARRNSYTKAINSNDE